MFLPPYREDVALLSAKYNIDTTVIAVILKAYLATADPVYRIASGIQDSLSGFDALYPQTATLTARLDSLSTAFGIPRDVVGALLFDLRLAHAAREAANR